MDDSIESVYDLLERNDLLSESFDIEFKSAKGGLPGSLWETYSAFANTEGGTIILGVREKDDHLKYDGLTESLVAQHKDNFWNLVNNKAKISVNLLTEQNVQIRQISKNKFLLAIKVPAADYKTKPVYVSADPLKGTYKRNNTGDYHCTPEEVRQMISDALPQKPDGRILEKFTMKDIDQASLLQYRQLFRSVKPDHPYLAEEDKGLLQKIGGWRKDRKTGQEGLTAAGLLMLGKHQSIIEAFPDFHLDYQEIMDNDRRWSDRVFPDGTWEANLFQFYRRVWPKISSALPTPFKLKGGQRQDEDGIHDALREALVNSLVHADYSGQGGIVIRRYTDSFQFDNPGNLLITVDQYYEGGISVPRNTSIQNMFLLLGYGEKAGSGSSYIMAAWEGNHWRKPLIYISSQPVRVTLVLLMESLLPEKTIQKLENRFGKDIRSLYGNDLIALVTAEIEGEITNSRMQQLTKAHSSEISRSLKGLCMHGYLFADGRGRGTIYTLNSNFEQYPAGSPNSNVASQNSNVGSSDPNVGSSDPNVGSYDPNVRSYERNGLIIIKKRISKKEMWDAILRICSQHYVPLVQIADRVSRKPLYLQTHVLPDMVKSGKLLRKYPETPNHPNQAYKSAE